MAPMALKRVTPKARTRSQKREAEKRSSSTTEVPATIAVVQLSSSALAWNSGMQT
ncbi:Uncharacterised protein [Bordetella pertussis]|nr:Uncharacterised protein [Bordetella pertussis]